MCITNVNAQIYPIDYNKWLKYLDTQLNESTNKNIMKVPKLVEATNKALLKKFEDLCNKQPNILFIYPYFSIKLFCIVVKELFQSKRNFFYLIFMKNSYFFL